MPAKKKRTEFEIIAANLPFWPDPAVAVASARAGGVGLLNLEGVYDLSVARESLRRLASFGQTEFAVKINPIGPIALQLAAELPDVITTVILSVCVPGKAAELTRRLCADGGRRVLVEVTDDTETAWRNSEFPVDGFIAKGNEAPGRVGEETTFILLQRLCAVTDMPVYAYGGIGLHSAAACYAAGAAGIVIDGQFALARESSLPVAVREAVAYLEGDETICVGADIGIRFRVLNRPSNAAIRELESLEQLLGRNPGDSALQEWISECERRIDWKSTDGKLWPLGQDATFAGLLARRFRSVSGIIKAYRRSLYDHIRSAIEEPVLKRDSALCRAHGTAYPIVQGPMTRVSDVPEFTAAVAEAGGLPFLALALLRADRVRKLLEETRELLGERPWGIGILGFVPPELRQEQLQVIRQIRPRFAIIAGGRPDQAARLEEIGIVTYLHVPSPLLLRSFLEGGARRFIFEGRECGGHVGPRSSFVLWNTVIDVLVESIDSGASDAAELHVLFAGGIHDSRSAAMVSAMAAPLAERGVRIGIVMGTAYLFTRESVESGAIVEGFQRTALDCARTVLLETGPGHATRCAVTPFCDVFHNEKIKLLGEKRDRKEVQSELEDLNLGRLRIASKGITREPGADSTLSYIWLDTEQQLNQGMYMIGQLASLREGVSSMTELHDAISVGGQKALERLAVPFQEPVKIEGIKPNPCDVAIIGMGCLLSGAQDGPTFWRNIIEKVDAIREIPSSRFDSTRYFAEDAKARDKIYSKWGGFLDDIPFDPFRYGIPPSALSSIDPLQLLSLEVVRQALEDAGYPTGEFNRENASVILGAGGGLGDLGMQYGFRSNLPMFLGNVPEELLEQLPEWTEDSFAGILLNVAAGRVANRFDTGGLNFTVDAACASSLAAVYLAARELQDGHSDVAIAGGVDTVQSPFGYLCFSKTRALSAQGRCRTFDDSADGIAISEGLVVLVLKRLKDAERDGDRIYAVLKSVAGSSDGRDRSLTAPRPEGQVRALRRAYGRAGISPSTVGLVEAHGTGTVAGDAAEIAALTDVFTAEGSLPRSSALGSVKSMIGHTKCAAGAAGLMKVALALYHRVLPPTLHVNRPNSTLRIESNPFFVNTEPLPWLPQRAGLPRRGAVSSFGFGGTNFHAVLEEYRGDVLDSSRRPLFQDWPEELFIWRSQSEASLSTTLVSLAEELDRHPGIPLRELAATVCRLADRVQLGHSRARLAFVVSSIGDLKRKVAAALAFLSSADRRNAPKGVYFQSGEGKPGKLAFLFSGQGAQHPFMLRDLAIHFPDIREALEYADELLFDRFDRRLSSYIYPPPSFTDDERGRQEDELTDTVIAQPALGVVELGLLRLLNRFGLKPEMVAGHSYGECVALYSAGVISEDDLLRLSEQRGRCIKEASESTPGQMLAVAGPAADIERLLRSHGDVWLANYNAPRQTIIAGSAEALDSAAEVLNSDGFKTRKIPVSCPFHTPILEPARERFANVIAEVPFRAPNCDVFSNSSGTLYPADPDEIRSLLQEHLTRPVQFVGEIEAMFEHGGRIFVEVGPKNILTGLASQILEDRDVLTLSSDLPTRNGLTHLLHLLGQLVVEGVNTKLDPLFEGRAKPDRSLSELLRRVESEKPRRTGWYVNGGKVWFESSPPRPVEPVLIGGEADHPITLGGSRQRTGPESVERQQQPSEERVRRLARKESVTVKKSKKAQEFAVGSDEASSSSTLHYETDHAVNAAGGDLERVMLGYQKLMGQFLETQKHLMTVYLKGEASSEEKLALVDQVGVSTPAFSASPPVSSEEDGEAEPETGVREKIKPPPDKLEPGFAAEQESPVPTHSSPGQVAPSIADRLLELVAERTGYPIEMLDSNLGIEADLGIDSIKRVEILNSFQQSCRAEERAGLQESMEKLTVARTLGEMVQELERILVAPLEGSAPIGKPNDTKSVENGQSAATYVPRFYLVSAEAPAEVIRDRNFSGQVVVITNDETGIAADLASRLQGRGAKPVVLTHTREGNGNLFRLDLTNLEEVERALNEIRQQHGPIEHLIHLLPLRSDLAFSELDLTRWRKRLQRDLKSIFNLTHLAQKDLQASCNRPTLLTVTAGSGMSFTHVSPVHGGITSFTNALASEWPEVFCRSVEIELDDASPSSNSQRIWTELHLDDELVLVVYWDGRRATPVAELAPFEDSSLDSGESLVPDSNWVFLLTGGARGITARIGRQLAASYQPTLILVGLSPVPADEENLETAGITDPFELKKALRKRIGPGATVAEVERDYRALMREREIRHNLRSLRKAGARVEYNQVDVRNEETFGSLIHGIYDRFGRLDGVIHGAGLIEDKLLKDKTPDSFDRVLHTKADSAFILIRNLRPEGLKSLVLMSSVTAVFGNRGQTDYAAANGILNSLALDLSSKWSAKILAANWGPWEQTGMVSDQVRAQFIDRGVQLIPPDQGAEIIRQEMLRTKNGHAVVVYGDGPWAFHKTVLSAAAKENYISSSVD